MKLLFTFLIVLFAHSLFAQCPYITGAMIDASSAGTPTGEGKNEFLIFRTVTTALSITGFSVGYGTSTAATSFTIDGSTVTWNTLAVSPAISNSAGTITNITSGSIPANTPVVILNDQNAISYDFAGFGPSVYVLVYSTGTGVSGFTTSGNFANKSMPAGNRYFRITAGACNNVVTYDKNASAMSSTDGAGAIWDASGTITYINSGSSGAVLPINLTHFDAELSNGFSALQWRTSGNSTAQYFEIEKSTDGLLFSKIGNVTSQKERSVSEKNHQFTIAENNSQVSFYRLRIVDFDETISYSQTIKLQGSNSSSAPNIYPNPFSNELHIINNQQKQYSDILILDLMGKTLLNHKLLEGDNTIDVTELVSGLHIVQLKSASETETIKVFKN